MGGDDTSAFYDPESRQPDSINVISISHKMSLNGIQSVSRQSLEWRFNSFMVNLHPKRSPKLCGCPIKNRTGDIYLFDSLPWSGVSKDARQRGKEKRQSERKFLSSWRVWTTFNSKSNVDTQHSLLLLLTGGVWMWQTTRGGGAADTRKTVRE